jgi:hypothetical protein
LTFAASDMHKCIPESRQDSHLLILSLKAISDRLASASLCTFSGGQASRRSLICLRSSR